ncbi:RNA-binding protein [Elizabethkingia anophelis]|uniref:RNA recognition motif domain-containing protein n=1 Tax=Elizabethkingia TaxID=308865 RepID=UPI00073991F0|nr:MULTISPECIES: RNA-binding protein [Elizabethkingia]KUF46719.1 RNA-binding protein [Elizabethkingia anophelis]MCT3644709.1 RNA-binding protein [Elizabethkingia anophelis]MCT3650690.1 RNA-binding protein [Elizabethkingia anophelis]MCT3655292.1 RNA-binding protein [Elizabethkingia anophelis]MCT3658458.1 RNA-binding protein [Elizabethkingia anophelis]
MNIFISNINYSVKESQLEELFASYGAIQSAKIIMDRETGRSRGFGFVEMLNNDEANTAIESLNGALFQGKNLNVSEARPKEEKPRRSFNNNRY